MSTLTGWNVHTILVPLDHSEGSQSALTAALNVAHCNGLETVHLVHAVDPDMFGAVSADLDHYMIEPLIQAGRELLSRAGERVHGAGLKAVPQLLENAPVDAILDAVAATHADLVVMATRGRSGLRRILGSVGLGVITYAPCSVLAVPEIPHDWQIRRILLPLDRFDEALVTPVVEIARKRGAQLIMLADKDEALADAQAALDRTGVNTQVLRTSATIAETARHHEADLVVVLPAASTHHNVKLDHRVQILLHELRCPLLIVRART